MLDKQNTGLIVVDIQGKLASLVQESAMLIANCEKLIKGARALQMPIICLEQNPEKLGPTVHQLNLLLDGLPVVSKTTFNACLETNFTELIKSKNIDTWLICGIESHICVYQTAMGLLNLGYKIHLISDCVSSRTANNKQLGINKLISKGVEISGLEMCLYELVRDCQNSEFKTILNLIK